MKVWTDRSCLKGSFTTLKVAWTYHVLAVAIISICLLVAKRRWRLSFTFMAFLKVSGMALWRKYSSMSKSVVVGSSGRRPPRARLHAMCNALAAGGWSAVTCRSTTSAMIVDAGGKIFSAALVFSSAFTWTLMLILGSAGCWWSVPLLLNYSPIWWTVHWQDIFLFRTLHLHTVAPDLSWDLKTYV